MLRVKANLMVRTSVTINSIKKIYIFYEDSHVDRVHSCESCHRLYRMIVRKLACSIATSGGSNFSSWNMRSRSPRVPCGRSMTHRPLGCSGVFICHYGYWNAVRWEWEKIDETIRHTFSEFLKQTELQFYVFRNS